MVVNNDQESDDDDQDGGISNDNNPVLDLPPGVGLPSKESILSVSSVFQIRLFMK